MLPNNWITCINVVVHVGSILVTFVNSQQSYKVKFVFTICGHLFKFGILELLSIFALL